MAPGSHDWKKDSIELLNDSLGGSRIAFEWEEVAPGKADAHRLGQVVKNLLSNAIKYSPSGSPIVVRLGQVEDRLKVSIRDNGIGMTADQQDHLFEKFYRADGSDTTISGTGLGLAICKLIIEKHGGEIEIESEFGKGTEVSFFIPVSDGSPGAFQ